MMFRWGVVGDQGGRTQRTKPKTHASVTTSKGQELFCLTEGSDQNGFTVKEHLPVVNFNSRLESSPKVLQL